MSIAEKLNKVRVVVINDANGQQRNKIYPLQVGFTRHGKSGIAVSNWFPHGSRIDDIAVIRSMWTTDDNHGQVRFIRGRICWIKSADNRCMGQLRTWLTE